MSKRLIRIKNKDAFQKLEKYIGAEVNVVSKNGNTHFGVLTKLTAEYLIVEDPRKHIHQLPFSEVYEIIMDTTANLQSLTI